VILVTMAKKMMAKMAEKLKLTEDLTEASIVNLFEEDFDARSYYNVHYKEFTAEHEYFLKEYFHLFKNEPELLNRGPENHKILDFGCGPVPIYGAIAVAAQYSKSITYADKSDGSRNEINKWMNDEKDAYNWKKYFEIMEEISGRRSKDIEKDLRAAFEEALFCDVRSPEVPIEGKKHAYDVIITHKFIETVCCNTKDMQMCTKKIVELLKPGGLLLMGGDLNLSEYTVGDTIFPSVKLNAHTLANLFSDEKMGLELLQIKISDNCKHTGGYESNECSAVFFIMAKTIMKYAP